MTHSLDEKDRMKKGWDQYLLHPIELESFFRSSWEKRPVHIKRDSKDHLSDLFTFDELDGILSHTELNLSHIRVARQGQMINSTKYSTLPTRINQDKGLERVIDHDLLFEQYHLGSTIIFESAQKIAPKLARLTQEMGVAFSANINTNIYLTPKGSKGFLTHYDDHDVFVVQFHGKKKWVVYDEEMRYPLKNSRKGGQVKLKDRKVLLDIELSEGDVLYIPKGFPHHAHTFDECSSGHITVGVTTHRKIDFLKSCLDEMAKNEPSLRSSLKPDFYTSPNFRQDELDEFKKIFEQLLSPKAMERNSEGFIDKALTSKRTSFLVKRIRQIEESHHMSDSSQLTRQPNYMFRLREEDNMTKLVASHKEVLFPSKVTECLKYIEQNKRFAVRDIPKLNKEGRLVLCKKLVREGVLRIVTI